VVERAELVVGAVDVGVVLVDDTEVDVVALAAGSGWLVDGAGDGAFVQAARATTANPSTAARRNLIIVHASTWLILPHRAHRIVDARTRLARC
jgi:hypothetical protein